MLKIKKRKNKRMLDALVLPRIDWLIFIAKALMVIGFLIIFISYVPSSYYAILDVLGINISTRVLKDTASALDVSGVKNFVPYQPEYDPSLPSENMLIIPSIKLNTAVHEASDPQFEEALKKGVWRVTNFGNPYARSKPTIFVAHRFGYLRWSINYRLKNSFYNLPKTHIGDRIEVVWDQRKYVYEIVKEEEGYAIADYSSDLILYTCKDLTSDVKIFRYAKLVEI